MKIVKRIIFLLVVFLINLPLVSALSVDNTELTVAKGEKSTVNVYADLKEETTKVSFSLVYTTYDVPATFKAEEGITLKTNTTKNTLTFSEAQKGQVKLGTIEISILKSAKANKGTIRLNSATATSKSGNISKLDPVELTVTIGTSTNNSTSVKESNLLKGITSKIVNIDLKDNVYTYEVNVKEDVKELDLVAVPKDEKSKVVISSQKISELKDGKITINVTSPSNTKEEYTVKVNVLKTDKVEIDKEEFKADSSYKGKWVVVIIVSVVALLFGFTLSKKEGK
ncbi:unknown [Clostridium sp. CAG:710]|nr:unknown [Clostridium sp. CAG:710]